MNTNSETAADQGSSKTHQGRNTSGGRGFSEQAGRVGEEVHELGRVAMAQAGEVASNLRDKGQDALETGRDKVKSAKGDFDKLVSAHPMKSVLIAVGVGAVLGYALRRRS